MKLIYILIVAILFCGIATASMENLNPHTIFVIVWDDEGNLDSNVAVTFTYMDQTDTLYTANDGSVSFSLLNFEGVSDGALIKISTKYETKEIVIDHSRGITGITFNEPSQSIAVGIFAMMGFIATAIAGGIYKLKRKAGNGGK